MRERGRERSVRFVIVFVALTMYFIHPPPPSLSLTQWPRETDERVLREWADPNIVAISKILSENAEMKRKRARERHTK